MATACLPRNISSHIFTNYTGSDLPRRGLDRASPSDMTKVPTALTAFFYSGSELHSYGASLLNYKYAGGFLMEVIEEVVPPRRQWA